MLYYKANDNDDDDDDDDSDDDECAECQHTNNGQTIDIIQEVGLSDEQMDRVYELIKSDSFIELKEQFQQDPTSINGVMEFINNKFSDLNEVFEKNKNLIFLILTGNVVGFEDHADESDESDEDENLKEMEEAYDEAQLTPQDRENITNVD